MTARPFPGDVVADAIDQAFWDACQEDRFLVYRCTVCDRRLWPAGACPEHGRETMEWVDASGRGVVHTWTVIHQHYDAGFEGAPDTVAVVQLDDGPFMHTALVEHDPSSLVAGLPVEVTFTDVGNGFRLPYFRPVRSADRSR